ncbi:helix-turn-helix transcriptional regulator [Streptomyces rectiviolaceus]|uniref:HTH cro/C1-type domain-containing protein n=1 Tax=Streptomyces rectiviolaceus TaxID=332591 RepID=A0ABP6MC07_9ACTN
MPRAALLQWSRPTFRPPLRGLTVPELAAVVGKSQWTIYRTEQGRVPVPVDLADALAEAVNVQLEALLHADPLAVGLDAR